MYDNHNEIENNNEIVNNSEIVNNTAYSTYEPGNPGVFTGSYQNVEPKERKKKKEKKSGFFKKAVVSISLGLLFGVFAGLGFYAIQQVTGLTQQASIKETVTVAPDKLSDIEEDAGLKLSGPTSITMVESDISQVVENVMPAMVSIINKYTEVGSFWGQTYTQEQESSGSGIVVGESDTELLIVSNYHVIADADILEVIFIDGSTAEAKVKGTDADMDLAVIAISLDDISEETMDAIAIATLGNSDDLKLGEPVIAIGNALGYGQSVTNGIVSALNRELVMNDGTAGTFIQTNAAINPGNSGGALLNIKGEVIGINSNKIGGEVVEGMGYAIPISSASPIIADLMERHTRDKVAEGESGYIGITLQEVTAQYSQMFNMPIGVFVAEVEEGSAAEKAGIIKGDVITRFDGEKINSYADLQEILQYFGVGDTAEITVMRQELGEYVEHDYEITLGKRPE